MLTSCPLSSRVQGCKGVICYMEDLQANMYLACDVSRNAEDQPACTQRRSGGLDGGGLRRAIFVPHHPPWILLGFLRAPPPKERSQLVSGRATGLPKEATGPGRRMQGTEDNVHPAPNLPREQEPFLMAPSMPNTMVRAFPVLFRFLP